MTESQDVEEVWANEERTAPPDPTVAENANSAVYVGKQADGDTAIVGKQDKEEWLITTDMAPLAVEEYR